MVAFLTSFLGPRLHLDFSVPIRLGGNNFSFLTINLRNDYNFVSSVSIIFSKRLLVSSYLSIRPSVRVEQLDPTEWIIVKFVF